LVQKLREEVAEFCDSGEVEELADILEVVYALASDQGVTPEELDKVRGAKRAERGGFNHRLFLVEDGAAS
jgi:predicted house-cleaning noncanonical NTP pyrophosphatase (MazG superfamily)